MLSVNHTDSDPEEHLSMQLILILQVSILV